MKRRKPMQRWAPTGWRIRDGRIIEWSLFLPGVETAKVALHPRSKRWGWWIGGFAHERPHPCLTLDGAKIAVERALERQLLAALKEIGWRRV